MPKVYPTEDKHKGHNKDYPSEESCTSREDSHTKIPLQRKQLHQPRSQSLRPLSQPIGKGRAPARMPPVRSDWRNRHNL